MADCVITFLTGCTSGHFVNLSMQHTRIQSPGSTREGANGVEPPDRERQGERDGLEGLSWLVDVLGVELACFASDDHCQGVLKGCRPVESLTEHLADRRA